MSEGNGHATDGMALPWKTVDFYIGGEEIPVRAIGFVDLEDDALRVPLDALGPALPIQEYRDNVVKIVAFQLRRTRPDLTYDVIRERLLAGEGYELVTKMNELFRASGFRLPEPTATPEENPGTGTSTDSAPSSPSEASAEAIPSS